MSGHYDALHVFRAPMLNLGRIQLVVVPHDLVAAALPGVECRARAALGL